MASALRHRGPDGISVHVEGASILGHALLDLGRNGLATDDHAVITFDGRIDNRDEIRDEVGAIKPLRDEALVLAAYHKWGSDAAAHLLGDFAYVVWDKRQNQMLCVRDQIGIRPFYYHDGADGFLFASEPQAILAQKPYLARDLDDAWIADYMAGYIPAAHECLHLGIRRLPPGHICVATQIGKSVTRYYNFHLSAPRARSDAAEDFAKIFNIAVACRLDVPQHTAALLSGGLDSSSIVTVAARQLEAKNLPPFNTFSMVFSETPDDDERPYIDAVVAQGGVAPTFLESGNITPFAQFEELLARQGGPFIAQNLIATFRLHNVIADRGFRVLLDGHGGDEVISHGTLWLSDLAFAGRWMRLWSEVKALCEVQDASAVKVFFSLIATRGPQRRFVRSILGALRRPADKVEAPLRHLYTAPNLADRTRLTERHRSADVDGASFGNEERQAHLADVFSDVQPYALELLDRVAAAAGIELRFPLLDLRVVEFCLSLPSKEKIRDGYTRSIIRRGLARWLPEAVRTRAGKLDFTPHVLRGMIDRDRSLIDKVLADGDGSLRPYANLDLLRLAWDDLKAGRTKTTHGFDIQAIWRAVALGLWLRQQKESKLGNPA